MRSLFFIVIIMVCTIASLNAQISQGGFEVLSPWVNLGSSGSVSIISEDVHSDNWAAKLTPSSGSQTTLLYQQLFIPAGFVYAEFEWWDKASNNLGGVGAYRISIRDTSMNIIDVSYYNDIPTEWGWTYHYFNLPGYYKGQTIRICFEEIQGIYALIDAATITIDGSAQLIQNPGFETSWRYQNGYPEIQEQISYAGDFAAKIADSNHDASVFSPVLYQTLTVANYGGGSPRVTFWDKGQNSTLPLSPPASYRVFIMNSAGTSELETLYSNSVSGSTWDWTYREFNLTAYDGQTIRICFEKTQNFQVYIDEVALISTIPSLSLWGILVLVIGFSCLFIVIRR
jgi:hypothetical protein